MTVAYRWENSQHVVDFDDLKEALTFVLEWQFGKDHYNFTVLKKWGLPRPTDAPYHVHLDRAIEAGLKRLLEK